MSITRLFLKRPTLVFVLVAITFMAGIMSLQSLVVQESPNSGLPTVTISVSYSGASTTDLQTEVAEPIENQLAGMPYLDHINTTIESGQVSIAAAFSAQSTDTENIANVERALQTAEKQLPSTITPPSFRVADPSEAVVVSIALVSSKYPESTLAAIANNSIVPVLEQVAGVSNVNVTGTTQPAFMVNVNPDLLVANSLTLSDVISAITPNNVRAPGGYVYQKSHETALDIRGDLPDTQSIANLPITATFDSTTATSTGSGASGSGVVSGSAQGDAVASADVGPNVAPTDATYTASIPRGSATANLSAPSTSTSGAATGLDGAGSTSSTTTTSGSASVAVDAPVALQSVSSNSAAVSADTTSAAQPSASSSEYGTGSGIATSPFLGSLNEWAVPTANKRISDVAQVLNSSVVPRVFASQNGKPGVTLLIQKESNASEVTVSNLILAQLPALRKKFPGVDFQVAHIQSTYTKEQVESVEHTLVEGIVLTAVVMLFFLGSWRNAVVVMIAIPTSLGVTLFVMKMLNLTLDTVSLMAMTLVIGILIDDSTVVLENIERHSAMGEAPPDAALNGRNEIGAAALVITMVDVIVFLPIAFTSGQVGQYLSEFAVVITIATLTSLFVSFTITPTLAGLWSLKSTWKPWPVIRWFDKHFERLATAYHSRWLPFALRFPIPVVVVAAILCALAILLVPTGLVGEEFIPSEDQGTIYAQVTLPPGHPLTDTQRIMTACERTVKQIIAPHDLQYETTIAGAYSAAFGGFVQEGNAGQITIYLATKRKTSTQDYVNSLLPRLRRVAPNAVISVTAATQQGGGNQQQIDEEVSTTNSSDPTAAAAKIFSTLKSTPGVVGAQNSASNAAPQMEVDFNRPALQSMNVSVGTAAAAIEAAFGGDVASQIETPDKGLTDIEVIYPTQNQTSLNDVLNIPIRTNSGGIVHIGDVAFLKYAPAPLIITRENRAQIVHVTANVGPGYNLSDVTKQFLVNVKKLKLGDSVSLKPAAQGQQDLMGQALQTLGASLAISIVLVFFMIVALYNSYRTPFVTLFAIPLATIGALSALWLTHSTLNLYSLIGMVLLVGLVTKNGILLVDYADTVRARGKSRDEGIRDAAKTRFRPIIMTTLAMVAGMLPLALGLEPGAQSRASLAIAVIGGLMSSLVLTLFIVPIMYEWIAPAKLKKETAFADENPKEGQPPHTGPVPA